MDAVTDPRLQHFPVNVQDYSSFTHPSNVHPSDAYQQSYSLMNDASTSASPLRTQTLSSAGAQGNTPGRVSTRASQNGGVTSRSSSMTQFTPSTPNTRLQHNGLTFKNTTSAYPNPAGKNVDLSQQSSPQAHYMHSAGLDAAYQPASMIGHLSPPQTPIESSPNPHSSTFPLVVNPPDLDLWRHRFFNIIEPLSLTEEQYLTYFPHVDNVYSHRSTQKYKRKPFVSHYWDCRLKGRPSGTPKSNDPNKKKRKRQARERDLCDVKIKVTEYFSAEEVRRLGLSSTGNGEGGESRIDGEEIDDMVHQNSLTIVMEDGSHATNDSSSVFGMLEPAKRYPKGHPGADGKRWYLIQRVNGGHNTGGNQEDEDDEGRETTNLDHKHTLEESDRIKKNSVQRWLLKEEKERKAKRLKSSIPGSGEDGLNSPASTTISSGSLSYMASGQASKTAKAHLVPSSGELIFFANAFCPFAQRIWIALEIKGIPYQYVQIMPGHLNVPRPPELLEFNPEGIIPCLKHGNWAIWESNIMMEYLEDLAMGHSLLPLGNPQLRAHCRLWVDHINRKILPAFYALLLSPAASNDNQQTNGDDGASDEQIMLITTLQTAITALVNASHATGPFFLGTEISFVDVAFAPWIIRLSRVLSYYRNFPRPEVGTRWQLWVDAVEADERVRRTVSDENSYHNVYSGIGQHGYDGNPTMGSKKVMVELSYARRLVASEGFGLGGDVWGKLKGVDGNV